MEANVVITDQLAEEIRSRMAEIPDFVDGPMKVSLVETAFNPRVKDDYPAATAAFPTINSPGASELMWDAATATWKILIPDPTDGWDFESTAGGVTIVGFKITNVGVATNVVGGNMFTTPIPIGGAGEHIVLPYLDIIAPDDPAPAITPYTLD